MVEVPASTLGHSFNCPHCGAYSSQTWHRLFAGKGASDNPLPITSSTISARYAHYTRVAKDATVEQRNARHDWWVALLSQQPFFNVRGAPDLDQSGSVALWNLHLSNCYSCKNLAIWVGDKLVFPALSTAPRANPDMPEEVLADFNEAREIVALSPRGAAALLRLCIQKICKNLGGEGKNINSDIGFLVGKGLSVEVQRALDVVRVIGNNAVHPGELDLDDNVQIATSLFHLVNLIVDKMISEPKRISDLYKGLPEGALSAIEKRDRTS